MSIPRVSVVPPKYRRLAATQEQSEAARQYAKAAFFVAANVPRSARIMQEHAAQHAAESRALLGIE